MLKIFLFFSIIILNAVAVNSNELVGEWYAYTESYTNGTTTSEEEHLHLNSDHTFNIRLFVSLEKEEAFIKDLRIEGSGIWKNRDNVLVMYIQKVEVPFAKEIYLISQESLRNLANNFKHKYENEPLKIVMIKSFTHVKLVIENEQLQETSYSRQ